LPSSIVSPLAKRSRAIVHLFFDINLSQFFSVWSLFPLSFYWTVIVFLFSLCLAHDAFSFLFSLATSAIKFRNGIYTCLLSLLIPLFLYGFIATFHSIHRHQAILSAALCFYSEFTSTLSASGLDI
jgi:hypothetical protein